MEGLLRNVNYALYLAHYDAYFQINGDAKKCRYLSVTNNLNFLIFLLNCSHVKYCENNALPWTH